MAELALVFVESQQGAFRPAAVELGLRTRQNRDFLGQPVAHAA
jgi:hypothetical protein